MTGLRWWVGAGSFFIGLSGAALVAVAQQPSGSSAASGGTVRSPALPDFQAPPSLAWTQEASSAGISQRGLPYSQVFRSPAPVPAGATITSVRVQRQASGSGYLATTLCTAPGKGTCIVVQGSHVSTKVFNGLPASQALYLTHTVMGEGPLVPPMFVRASVTVWYTPVTPVR